MRVFRGFVLIDVLMAIMLSTLLVIVVAVFSRETMIFSSFVERHQQIRQESFALVNTTLASLIREAVAIDYENSDEHRLSLFMDKWERDDRRVQISWEQGESVDGEERSQLILVRGDEETVLNSSKTVITAFDLEYSRNPKTVSGDQLQDARAYQPMVSVYLAARYQRPDGAQDRVQFSFWEDPRVSYRGTYALRNYSFSNLR